MKLQILGRDRLEKILKENPQKYDVIHYTASESPPNPIVVENALEWLHMPIDDLDHYNYKINIAAKAEDVKKFLGFAKGRKELLVACAAGISRSSATAYAIMAQEHGLTEALSVLKVGVHWPNRLIVFMAAEVLGDLNIWDKYVKWMRKYHGHDPSEAGVWPTPKVMSEMNLI
jgi:predicted protein tyrosine phosphatase